MAKAPSMTRPADLARWIRASPGSSDRPRWLGPARSFPADRSTRAYPQRTTERPWPYDLTQKPEWAQPGYSPGLGTTCRILIPGQTWGHLSHKYRLFHSGGGTAAFVPGGTTAATLLHTHGCRQGKCLVAQRKNPVVHSGSPALLLRLCFYKDIQGRTRNNRAGGPRACPCLAAAREASPTPSMPADGHEKAAGAPWGRRQ